MTLSVAGPMSSRFGVVIRAASASSVPRFSVMPSKMRPYVSVDCENVTVPPPVRRSLPVPVNAGIVCANPAVSKEAGAPVICIVRVLLLTLL